MFAETLKICRQLLIHIATKTVLEVIKSSDAVANLGTRFELCSISVLRL